MHIRTHLALTYMWIYSALLLDIQQVSSSTQLTVLDVQDNVSKLTRQYELDRLDNRHRGLLQRLSPVNPEQSHKVTLSLHQEDTSDWIRDTNEVLEWKGSNGSCLWLNGLRQSH